MNSYPFFKGVQLEDLTRKMIKDLAFACLKKGKLPKTVHDIVRALSSMLSHAVEDGLLTVNPALRPGKFLPAISSKRAINPYTREEVATLLEVCKSHSPRLFPLLLCAVRAGLRQGELIALHWQDIDFRERFLEVRRNFARGKLTTPKSGHVRRVDMSLELTQTLRNLHVERELETMQAGWEEIPPWVFCDEKGKPWHHNHLRKGLYYRVQKASGLRHIRFHDLRHTFASLLLQQGESPVYVKEQMGHSSIQVTVDLYGHLIPGGNKQAVDRLDSPIIKSQFVVHSATQPQPPLNQGTVLPS